VNLITAKTKVKVTKIKLEKDEEIVFVDDVTFTGDSGIFPA
jgi:hypothetical protein